MLLRVPSSLLPIVLLTLPWMPLPAQTNATAAAYALEQQGKDQEAQAAWEQIAKAHPADAEAYANLGLLHARQQQYPQAITFYRKAQALNPAMPGLQMNLGLALFKSGNLRGAMHEFEPLLKKQDPASPDAQRLRILVGMCHYGLGEYPAAVPPLREAMQRDPQDLPYRLVLAHSCLRAKQYQCVLDVYHEILSLNAESAEADMLAGEALDEMHDHNGAVEQFRAAVKADPKQPGVHFGLAYLLWTGSQWDEAEQQFQAELENNPQNVQALVYLADSQIRQNHFDTARPLLEKAVRIDPKFEMAHLEIGILDSQAGKNEEALRELHQAATLNPKDVQVHWRLARLYQAMGRKQEAQAEFDRTKTLTKAADETVYAKLNPGTPK
ncbi:MAG TPA: tetratricopeptide repeat protein [Acidobacteriaceae bacterium]|nr:tetratricopeptide repeat protein [Acidobacteriaceae bacterium]